MARPAGRERRSLNTEKETSYLQGRINALQSKDAKGWIIRAASQAQKAANYILNIEQEEARP